ncbi:MAG TPA: DUF4446 family protein [Solirubrobacteraceae bacterium]|jgi:hypothetical protein|nr:DUF4446 family protein [Solirubrobacteraceae bacterium]
MLAALSGTNGAVAVGAAGAAVIALLACASLALALRRMRRAQRVVLGDRGSRDVVEHAAELEGAFDELHAHVDATSRHSDGRIASVEAALRGTIAHRALVRYDAYNELSGYQSVSIALLDDEQSGIVLSSIHHRDQARVYAKAVVAGQGELELSPEEAQAVAAALAPTGTGGHAEHPA